jgi:cytochrome c nitrite reductase small subunit
VPSAMKIIVAIVCALLCLVGAGMVGLRDMAQSPQFCATCHVVKPYVESWQGSDYLAHTHAQLGIPCQTCHPQTIKTLVHEVVSQVRGNYDNPLSEIKVPKKDCFRCHGDYASLAEKTSALERNPHNSHWGELDCRVCHKMHKQSVDYCSQCHGPTTDLPGWKILEQKPS